MNMQLPFSATLSRLPKPPLHTGYNTYRVPATLSAPHTSGGMHFKRFKARSSVFFFPQVDTTYHFPCALVFVPRSHGGLEFVHLYLLQGQYCLTLLLCHTLHQTHIGKKQICIDIAWI
jgi:hypothetical protein